KKPSVAESNYQGVSTERVDVTRRCYTQDLRVSFVGQYFVMTKYCRLSPTIADCIAVFKSAMPTATDRQ
ncbi:MAG: hypothetical protein WBM44_10350, partial [Waterburya sp.]